MLGLFILLILIILPPILYIIFTFALDLKIKLRNYYMVEALLLLLVTAAGQLYFYQKYDLNIFPGRDTIEIIVISIITMIIVFFLLNIIYRIVKKENWLSMKAVVFIATITL